MPRRTPSGIIVLGAERSGTSVTTEMIHRWGGYVGPPEKLTGASEHSPQGQWEYEPLWEFLAELGDFSAGASWWDPVFEKRLQGKLQRSEFGEKARALMAEMERDGRPWVWKDPALCHFLPFWQPLWGAVTYVILVRHPYDIASSWQRMVLPAPMRETVNLIACNLLRWQHILLLVLRATEASDRKLFVEYEALIRDPLSQARCLARFLDARHTGIRSEEQTLQAMADAVNPSLRRNRSDRNLSEVEEATPDQQRLYDFLRRKVDDPNKPFVDAYPMPPDWWEFVRDQEAMVQRTIE